MVSTGSSLELRFGSSPALAENLKSPHGAIRRGRDGLLIEKEDGMTSRFGHLAYGVSGRTLLAHSTPAR